MKILVLFGPDSFGGSFVVAEKISRKYKEEGHEVLFVLKDPEMVSVYKAMGYKVEVLGSMTRKIRPISDVLTIWRLYKLYVRENCDLIHSHTSKSGMYARALKFFRPKVRVLHTVHGYYFPNSRLAACIFKMIEACLIRYCDAIAFVNREDYVVSRKWYKHPLARLIHNGTELPRRQANAPALPSPLRVAINARLVWEKGYRDIIKLVKVLESSHYIFYVMGDGKDGDSIKNELVDFENVHFLGQIDWVQELLATCHINLLLSYREGLSLSILESMALGIPTVAYDIRGNRELINNGEDGILASVGDIEGLRVAMEQYRINHEIRSQHGAKAKEKVVNDFNVEQMLSAYVALVKQIRNKDDQ